MPFNVMLQLCRVTRASKLFQRNFYLPLLRPLSPKDALRRHIITGKHLLGHKVEHYIPVLEEYQARQTRRKYVIKGKGKKRQRKKNSMKYVQPFIDTEIENHDVLENMMLRKPKGKGQCYTYYVPEKDCTLVFSHQWERAIRDKDILDITIAQKAEKILVKTKTGLKITVPVTTYDGKNPFYRGEGWTKQEVEEFHHFGKETMNLAKLFEAKEQGVDEWELEMMRLASKRKVKQKGEGTREWKNMMQETVQNMDWDQFESDTKQIVEEIHEPIEEEPLPLAVDDMEKTKWVNDKLKQGGKDILDLLPIMQEIPEIVRNMHDGELTEVVNVSGLNVALPSGTTRFIAGQIIKGDEGNEMFMPGQSVETEDDDFEYTPGFTVLLDGEPTLIPGLVMGDDPTKPMFLPGDSVITEYGLQFAEHEDDRPHGDTPEPEPEPEEQELEEEEEEERKSIIEIPRKESEPIIRKERIKKKPRPWQPKEVDPRMKKQTLITSFIFDATPIRLEKEIMEQEKERLKRIAEKKSQLEWSIEKRKREIVSASKAMIAKQEPPPEYVPLDPVEKKESYKEMEEEIKKGEFLLDHRKYIDKGPRTFKTDWQTVPFVNNISYNKIGINRHLVLKTVVDPNRRYKRPFYQS